MKGPGMLLSKNPFHAWYKRATVRTQPRRVLEPGEQGQLFFKPELVAPAQHPLIVQRGQGLVEELLIRHLHTYLNFTESLEHEVVNDVAYAIGRGRMDLGLPEDLKLQAFKLYVDEANHTLFSADLQQQVVEATGVTPTLVGTPRFLKQLRRIINSVSREDAWLVKVFFTIVSETLISGTLTKVPRDPRVVPAVRAVLKDHADDEAIHHAYFAGLLQWLWPRLTEQQRRIVGPLLPEFILGFLEPDYDAVRKNLLAAGIPRREAGAVIEDCYPREEVLKGVRQASAVTVTHFYNTGVFEDDSIGEAFERKGIPPKRAVGGIDRIAVVELFELVPDKGLVDVEKPSPAK